MKPELNIEPDTPKPEINVMVDVTLRKAIEQGWQQIAPFWPLENLIAVNPLQGFEHKPIEDAWAEADHVFRNPHLPTEMQAVNRETIKWCQAFLDEGQATVPMPDRHLGFYHAWVGLAPFDRRLNVRAAGMKSWLANLPETPEAAIRKGLEYLRIQSKDRARFLGLLLTTMPGWAGYVKYRTDWAAKGRHAYPITQTDYLAVRIVITCAMWPDAHTLLSLFPREIPADTRRDAQQALDSMAIREAEYRSQLLGQLSRQSVPTQPSSPKAQLVFCIDVRSEPFRRALESTGAYQTLGFAGFFGVPVRVHNQSTGEVYDSCPVLLSPQYDVQDRPRGSDVTLQKDQAGYRWQSQFKRLYQSLKYTFSAPFALVEAMGWVNGLWMAAKTWVPAWAGRLRRRVSGALRPGVLIETCTDNIHEDDQAQVAENALRMMGLTRDFAPLVVLCGHGSTTHNNAYATALDCGACGGRHGGSNARVLANLLNRSDVRARLKANGIAIPKTTRFLAAEHNTTTDAVEVFSAEDDEAIAALKRDLETARDMNTAVRLQHLDAGHAPTVSAKRAWLRSQDWAQVRPEWGLARNAAFVVGPRALTRDLDLGGRCFLHSYEPSQDPDGQFLTTILTAPMVVAQWINCQYLFSTFDNAAYGGGSKITKNITGKIGIVQGNGSDLMTGLPLQSVYAADGQPFHEPQRLLTVVYAPRDRVDAIIKAQPVLQTLFGNGWVTLANVDPDTHTSYVLSRSLRWQPAS